MASTVESGADELKPKLRSEAVYLAVRDAIITHRLAPGTKLPEDELAQIYAVSRTIVRTAIQALAHDGLVELELNRGAFVARPSRKVARETFEARTLIEPRLAATAALVATDEEIALLRQRFEEEHQSAHSAHEGDAIKMSADFHLHIAEISQQSVLIGILKELLFQSSLIISLYWRRHDTTCDSHAHGELMKAIAAHDEEQASEVMKGHIIDLMSGLDLTLDERTTSSLAEILDPAR